MPPPVTPVVSPPAVPVLLAPVLIDGVVVVVLGVVAALPLAPAPVWSVQWVERAPSVATMQSALSLFMVEGG